MLRHAQDGRQSSIRPGPLRPLLHRSAPFADRTTLSDRAACAAGRPGVRSRPIEGAHRAANDAWRSHSVALRRFYYLAILLVTSVGFFLFVLSESTERWFAWTISPPLTAAFLGANYWAAFFLAFLSAREPVWARARITYAVSIVFISLTSLATLLHLDKFNFDNANGWLWVIVYVIVPPLLVVLLVQQLRLPGADPPREALIQPWLMPIVAVQGLVVLAIGAALVVAPSRADSLWPWTLTPLTSRTVGAWLLALAVGLAVTIWERDWTRIRVSTLTFAAAPVLQFVALARYSDTVNWDTAGIWLYVAFLASILVLGLYGLWRSFAAGREPTTSPVATTG